MSNNKLSMFEKLLFHNRLGRLTSRETEYWRMMFSKTFKVGEEFEVQIPNDLDSEDIYSKFENMFRPSRNVDIVGEYGIYDVKRDGSVPNGMELVTVGRRFHWNTFYDMNKRIMDKFREDDFYTSYHTGMHIHLLAGYSRNGTQEMEKPVPEIIMANYYQLHRIFAPELFWIASGGANDYAITRYILFRRPPFDYSAVTTPMEIIRAEMNGKYEKYQMFNMNWSQFMNRQINRFHVEARFPDTILSPAYATALCALEVALLQKAIDLSQCGIISMKQDEYEYRVKLFNKFANMGTGERESDSTELTDEDISQLQIMTSNMIRFLKSEIISLSNVAYNILSKVAVTPASLMRINGKNWRQIEEEIFTPELVDSEKKDKLIEIIVLQQITDCTTPTEWRRKVSNRLSIDLKKTQELIEHLSQERIVFFDRELGSMLFKQTV